ncbi:Zinc finger protein [Plakobranchus ocellatus]|uniref:Zinc finger protein n=1 Tax=Plakobranchus ocellatus TaxID=259542 RepID=A0AAV4AFV4_9GAST|nr:Zinc finger protein [Plakobranchus ocellatus]
MDLKFGDELPTEQRRELKELAHRFSSIISDRFGKTILEEHSIKLTFSTPVRQRPCPITFAIRHTLCDELEEIENLAWRITGISKKMDLGKGYWQIPVSQENILKTAFVAMDRHNKFLKMPFGMMSSGATLTRAVKMLMRGMNNVMNDVDDLLAHTPT